MPEAELLSRFLNSLRDTFILVVDQERRIVYANAPFLEHFRLRGGEVVGRLCAELPSPFADQDGSPISFGAWTGNLSAPASLLLTREFQGKKFVYEAVFYQLAGGDQDFATVCLYQQVTDESETTCPPQQCHELERSLVQASIDGIIVNDLEGNVLIYNEGAAKILGYTPQEVIGKIKVGHLYPPGLAHEIKHKIYDPEYGGVGILENFETVVRHQDGSLVPIWLSARLLREGAREIGIVGYFRDLRERKRLEEEVLRNERLATLGKMVAHITHEIKNPMLIICGFARQLQRLAELPEDARQKLQLIKEEVRCLEEFLSHLGSFAHTTPTKKVPGDLPALIREVAELMDVSFKEQGVAFKMDDSLQAPPVPFDPGQMRQVLINIFKNAQEAMPQGGRLSVSLEIRGGDLFLLVADTGQGIAPEHLPDLFTPFFTTKEKGTGLGLSICRHLIEQHQGEIRITSEVNRGTTCTIRLPLSSA